MNEAIPLAFPEHGSNTLKAGNEIDQNPIRWK
jgi:hypothetical protein